MAARTLVCSTPVLAGASITSESAAMASSDTCTISVTTAQSALDFAGLTVRASNVNSITSVILSMGVGTGYSDIGVGAKSITVPTATAIIIGGQGFESARFLTTAGTLVFTATGTGPTSMEAYLLPNALD